METSLNPNPNPAGEFFSDLLRWRAVTIVSCTGFAVDVWNRDRVASKGLRAGPRWPPWTPHVYKWAGGVVIGPDLVDPSFCRFALGEGISYWPVVTWSVTTNYLQRAATVWLYIRLLARVNSYHSAVLLSVNSQYTDRYHSSSVCLYSSYFSLYLNCTVWAVCQ